MPQIKPTSVDEYIEAAIQISYDQPLPKELIRKIAAFRFRQVRENDARWMYRENG